MPAVVVREGALKLGRYKLIRELGQGGMATAYLGEAPGGMEVVLKTPHITDEEVNERLRDEARTGIRLAHPAVVETLDLFEHHGKPVLVVAFIDGASVDEMRRMKPILPAAVARIGWQIAQGLHAVHSCTDENGRALHMVHRDVTAPNVLVDKVGDARLIDLGIARSVENIAATTPGTIKGTVRYLAPELLQGLPPSPQSDLWGLGCVLFEAVTGRPIYSGAPAQTMIAILREPPMTKPAMAEIPEPLRRCFEIMFNPDHSARTDDGYELGIELQKAEAELSHGAGAADATSLAVIETVAAKPSPGPPKLPPSFGDPDEDDAASPPAVAPAAPSVAAPSVAAPSVAATAPGASAPAASAPPSGPVASPFSSPTTNAASGPPSPAHGSGPFGRGTPVTGTPAHGIPTPFNTPMPGTIASGSFPKAPGIAAPTASPPPQLSNPIGVPAQPAPASGFGAAPSSGLFQLPPPAAETSGPMPAAPPAASFAPPPPAAPAQPRFAPPNPLAASGKIELGAREEGGRKSSRVLTGRNSLVRERAAAGPSPFAGIASTFVKVVLVALALGLAWRFVIRPSMQGKSGGAGDTGSVVSSGDGIDGPSYEEIQKQELLDKQRARIKNLPSCWKGDDGYKFVYTKGKRNVVVDKITKVPTNKRASARCVLAK